MFDLFAGASPALWLWVLGVVILGAALAYGVFRAGWLRPRERAQLDQTTRAVRDPRGSVGSRAMKKSEARGGHDPLPRGVRNAGLIKPCCNGPE